MKTRMIAFKGRKPRHAGRKNTMTARQLFDEYNKHGPYKVAENWCSVTRSHSGADVLWVGMRGRCQGWKAWRVKRYVRKSALLRFVSEGTVYDAGGVQWGLGE